MQLFTGPGPRNTEQALAVLSQGLEHYGTRQVVVASTFGDSALAVARQLRNSEVDLVVVTHNFGFKEQGKLEMAMEIRAEIEAMGARVLTGTMPFRNIGTAIREKQGYSQQDLVFHKPTAFSGGPG